MFKLVIILVLLCTILAQETMPTNFVNIVNNFKNTDSNKPWGVAHEKAPEQVKQFGQLAGLWSIKTKRMAQDGTWSDGRPSFWAWKYILDGYAVQDLYLEDKGDGQDVKITQLRQFNLKTMKWDVSWINTADTKHGNFIAYLEDNALVMIDTKELDAPKKKIVFKNISDNSFTWEYQIISQQTGNWFAVAIFTATRMND